MRNKLESVHHCECSKGHRWRSTRPRFGGLHLVGVSGEICKECGQSPSIISENTYAWTIEKPTVPGQYLIRPLPEEKYIVGSKEIVSGQEVTIDYVRGQVNQGLCIFSGFGAINVAGAGLEFCGPLEPPR